MTAFFALGYRVDFTLNDSLQNRKRVAGAANPTDPNGQVVPLDYIGTNSKHWAKIGGFEARIPICKPGASPAILPRCRSKHFAPLAIAE